MLGNNMFAYCGNSPTSRRDPSGNAFVHIGFGFDTMDLLCPALGGSSGGGAVYILSYAVKKTKEMDSDDTESVGVVVGTSSYGHTTGGTGSLVYDSSGDLALQLSQTIGESTCLIPGASIGVCRTYSTANDVQHMMGQSSSVGFTICLGYGISFDLSWFETPTGREYAITVGVLFGAELEAHGAASYTQSTKSWNPFG